MAVLSFVVALPASAQGNDAPRYQTPPSAMVDMVDAKLIPQTALSPNGEWLMLLDRPALPSVAELAQPELRLAGMRINPRTNDQSRTQYANGIKFVRVADRTEKAVSNLPANVRIADALWSPDSKRVAFTVVRDTGLELMVVELGNGGNARKLLDRNINGITARSFAWFGDSKSLLVAAIPVSRGAPPRAPQVSSGPLVQENLGRRNAARTYQDLLRNAHDEALFEYYSQTEVLRVNLEGGVTTLASGLVRNMQPSPDGQYVMLQYVKRPFSYSVPVSRFALRTEIRDAQENDAGALVKVLSDLPLAEDEDSDPDAVRKGPRNYQWRSDSNATIAWVQAAPTEKRNSIGDYLFSLSAPFNDEPQLMEKTDLRIQSVLWA
ncbi:MAG: hypothetical protein LW838_03750, partial [Nitrosomonadaceae bacterium]|nr:hypothetical protein [Nitrosomonadaceae bacterium]